MPKMMSPAADQPAICVAPKMAANRVTMTHSQSPTIDRIAKGQRKSPSDDCSMEGPGGFDRSSSYQAMRK